MNFAPMLVPVILSNFRVMSDLEISVSQWCKFLFTASQDPKLLKSLMPRHVGAKFGCLYSHQVTYSVQALPLPSVGVANK